MQIRFWVLSKRERDKLLQLDGAGVPGLVYSSLLHTDYHKEYLWLWRKESGILGGIFKASQRGQDEYAAKPSLGLCDWPSACAQPSSRTTKCCVFAAWLSLLFEPVMDARGLRHS